jgi:hypothetical protein
MANDFAPMAISERAIVVACTGAIGVIVATVPRFSNHAQLWIQPRKTYDCAFATSSLYRCESGRSCSNTGFCGCKRAGTQRRIRHQEGVPLPDKSEPAELPQDALNRLQEGFASWRTHRTLTPEANAIVADLCRSAKQAGWSPEQLVVAVKNACNDSPEIREMTTTSERDAFLGRLVTACIKEFFR